MGTSDHLTCLLRNLYADQEAIIRTGHETTDWFQIGKGVMSRLYVATLLLYAEYIMWNAWLAEAQDGVQIAGRNINNLRHSDDTTVMGESEGELKSLLIKVKKKSGKPGLKLTLKTPRRSWHPSGPNTSWQIHGETMETVRDFIFGGLQNHCRWWLQPRN